jgi:hypothetical protein
MARDQLGRFTGDFYAQVMRAVDAASKADPRLKEFRAQGYTEEGIDAVLQLGLDRGIDDPREAAEAYERAFPRPTMVATSGGRWSGLVAPAEPDHLDLADLMQSQGNDERWTAKAVASTLRRVRRREQDETAPLHLLSVGF